ncbi:MAG: DUF4266 domain-containing protein [Bacteroidota bacterium]
MKHHRKPLSLILLLLIAGSLSSCVSVKAYQKMYLNDEDMALSSRHLEGFESNVQVYREGASGANGGKVGGGCGCN